MDPLQQEYVVCGTLDHDGKSYPNGTVLPPGFFTSEYDVAAMRHFGAIKLPAEALPAEAVTQQVNALQEENTSLRERLAALEAQQQTATFPGSSEA